MCVITVTWSCDSCSWYCSESCTSSLRFVVYFFIIIAQFLPWFYTIHFCSMTTSVYPVLCYGYRIISRILPHTAITIKFCCSMFGRQNPAGYDNFIIPPPTCNNPTSQGIYSWPWQLIVHSRYIMAVPRHNFRFHRNLWPITAPHLITWFAVRWVWVTSSAPPTSAAISYDDDVSV